MMSFPRARLIRHPVAVAVVGGLLVLLVPGTVWAQESPSTQGSLWPDGTAAVHPFDGFGGLAWGVDSASVTNAWGEPDRRDAVSGSALTALVYADTSLAGEAVSIGFLVHPERGLVRGQALFPYRGGEDCWRLLTRIRDLVAADIPGQTPQVHIERGPEDLSFCTAFQLGAAEARAMWHDPESGSRVTLMLDLSAAAVRLSYESPSFREIVRDSASRRR